MATISSGPPSSIPVSYVNKWYAGPDGENISQASNQWTGTNIQRWQSPEFDALYRKVAKRSPTMGISTACLD